jgi:small neutral amino acid transporter SnatA (MarC family)
MNGPLLAVAMIGALNPFRSRVSVPETARGRARVVPLVLGGLLAITAVASLSWWSGPLLRALQITPETFKIAAGFVAVLAGGYAFVVPVPHAEPELPGWRAGLWPVMYPRLLSPEVMVMSLAAGAGNGVAATTGAVAAGVAILIALVPVEGSVARRLVAWFGRILALALIVVGIWLAVDGVRDV